MLTGAACQRGPPAVGKVPPLNRDRRRRRPPVLISGKQQVGQKRDSLPLWSRRSLIRELPERPTSERTRFVEEADHGSSEMLR